jgi:phosphoribosylformylglycinamidine synthase
VCVGADYNRIAILDNFCWPSVDDEKTMGTLVRACEACYDAAKAYGIPFISGKDSLHNQFTNQETGEVIRIPPTLLISALGIVGDVRKCVTMDFKQPGAAVYLIITKDPSDLGALAATHRAIAQFIAAGHVAACHDVSDGGIAVAAAEMCIASGYGITLDPDVLAAHDPFGEQPGGYLIELRDATAEMDFPVGTEAIKLGNVQVSPRLVISTANRGESGEQAGNIIALDEMTTAWRGTLDW